MVPDSERDFDLPWILGDRRGGSSRRVKNLLKASALPRFTGAPSVLQSLRMWPPKTAHRPLQPKLRPYAGSQKPLVFSQRKSPLIWLQILQCNYPLWNSFLEFGFRIKEECSQWSEKATKVLPLFQQYIFVKLNFLYIFWWKQHISRDSKQSTYKNTADFYQASH